MAIVATFTTADQARDAVDRVIAAGVPADHVSAVTPRHDPAVISETPAEEMGRVWTRVGVGAALGALASAAIALLLPGGGLVFATGPVLLSGALGGGLIGWATAEGFSQEDAERIAERHKAGRYLVIVHAAADVGKVQSALLNAGAEDVYVTREAEGTQWGAAAPANSQTPVASVPRSP
jgi:outer membrane lipoprotein SlyB